MRRRLLHVQNKRKPWRCQAMTVSGFTMTSAVRHALNERDRQARNSPHLCSAIVHRGRRYLAVRRAHRPARSRRLRSEAIIPARMIRAALLLLRDSFHFVALTCSSHRRLAAKNLFLRKQLAFYIERKVRPRRLNDAARIALVVLARAIDWRRLLVVVRPDTLVRWHRQGFRLFWRCKSRRPGPPPDSGVPPGLDRRHGARESDLG